jgi:hypothetical protein
MPSPRLTAVPALAAALLLATLPLAASAQALDHARTVVATPPAKPAISQAPPPPDPGTIRQGGDTIADAILLQFPAYDIAGTTVGYTDDYDEVCPYQGSVAPDLVYSLQPPADMTVDIDMLGSDYDTKIYVYDESLALVACNDDFYADYVSRIENCALAGGATYYLVIDGYGSEAGEYLLNVSNAPPPCFLECDSWQVEGEPPLVYGYEDAHNGGCNSPEFGSPLQPYLVGWFCGTSGWYVNYDGIPSRDTDWYEVDTGPDHVVEIYVDAEQPTFVFHLAPQDCGEVDVVQSIEVGPCAEGMIAIPAEPFTTIWLWIGPTTFEGPVDEYRYTMFRYWWSATETRTLSSVKALFD